MYLKRKGQWHPLILLFLPQIFFFFLSFLLQPLNHGCVSSKSPPETEASTFLQIIKSYAPDSAQLLGLFTLFIFTSILIILTRIIRTVLNNFEILDPGLIGGLVLLLLAGPGHHRHRNHSWLHLFYAALILHRFEAVTVAVLSWTCRYVNDMH
ncbi:hypothetical protein GQ457_03G012950 [Hibiscus cannabinus]